MIFSDSNVDFFYKVCLTEMRIGGWSNGKTADSDSAYRGSNPCPPARKIMFLLLSRLLTCWHKLSCQFIKIAACAAFLQPRLNTAIFPSPNLLFEFMELAECNRNSEFQFH